MRQVKDFTNNYTTCMFLFLYIIVKLYNDVSLSYIKLSEKLKIFINSQLLFPFIILYVRTHTTLMVTHLWSVHISTHF